MHDPHHEADLKGPPEGLIPADAEIEELLRAMLAARRCRVCCAAMTHTRLNGYVCPFGHHPTESLSGKVLR